ncbi:hypothetical protein PUNSTDRAFT_140471 [Punctularia strigosozonata HHB-11173 SS5]|uniref:uncharacterized protein n=1 Tax=Punctularia strigosozonata (strain HHB-11173) TaxID=741275 RepID=UPI00044181A6|nr:uncharacterized protein PUNSTDRAFT_140471 [Punctularia strigosozonata HHB-11173 SS5]EIN14098.1 hypothetical protein PUNSTDRAFT_140471 [Punctularia strigosozonata HHB-11173 SS5]
MAAPSFSSFPPSFGSFTDADTRQQHSQQNKSVRRSQSSTDEVQATTGPGEYVPKEKRRQLDVHRSKTRDKKHRGREHERHGRLADVDTEDHIQSLRQDALEGIEPRTRPLYITDRKGDPLNVHYGGLHAGDVPKYRLLNHGRTILGLGDAFKVVHRGRKGIEIGLGNRRRQPALTDKATRELLSAPPVRSYAALSGSKYKYNEIDGFLRLPSSRAAYHNQAYRSIGRVEGSHESDSSSDGDSRDSSGSQDDSGSEDGIHLNSHQLAVKAAEQKVSQDPSDLSAWFDILAFSLSTIPPLSKDATKARAEITITVLDRAFKASTENNHSVSLWLRYIAAHEELLEAGEVNYVWEKAIQNAGRGADKADLWIEWLDWSIRRSARGMDGILEAAVRAVRALHLDEIGRLRVLWRVAVAFRDAGFSERATAVFQAQAELTFGIPQSLYGLPLERQLGALEEFWDSEHPRLGDEGARGWAAWVSGGRPEHRAFVQTVPLPAPDVTTSDPYARWATEEYLSDHHLNLPKRSAHDTSNDADPYSVIMFSEVQPLLSLLTTREAKLIFRLCWLSDLGLPIPGLTTAMSPSSTDDRWASSYLATPSHLSAIFPPATMAKRRITADSHAGVLVGREREYASCGPWSPVKSWGRDTFGPLDSLATRLRESDRSREGGLRWWSLEDVQDVDVNLVRRVFEHCRCGPHDIEWDTLALAFEACIDVKSAIKLSKSLLADTPDSVQRWTVHARLERIRGRMDDARKVYKVVLSETNVSATTPYAVQLIWDYAEAEWINGDNDAAMHAISRAVGIRSFTGVGLLRTKRSLEEMVDHVRDGLWKDRESWIKLQALLELLTSSHKSAMAVFDAHLSETEGTGEGRRRESLTIASLVMLYHHSIVLRNPMPPSILRERLYRAVEAFPGNTIILGMFLEAEKGQGLWGRVRGVLGETAVNGVVQEKDVARRVAEVLIAGWERGRWDEEKERTRGGLSAAVQNVRTRGSAVIWRIYLEFEIRCGEFVRAKNLLYRAVAECPLNKQLYLLAFGPLRSTFTAAELDSLVETMAERGLRLRRGLDEVATSSPAGSVHWAPASRSEDYGEEEIEERAREMRRLRPY